MIIITYETNIKNQLKEFFLFKIVLIVSLIKVLQFNININKKQIYAIIVETEIITGLPTKIGIAKSFNNNNITNRVKKKFKLIGIRVNSFG